MKKIDKILEKYPEEKRNFEKIKKIKEIKRNDINSSGYVIHTLEAVYWSLLNSESYFDAITKAVHLGGDTDTIGAITGSLAGMIYEEINVPKEWFEMILKRKEINKIIKELEDKMN